jgi:hypothetical protein
LREQRIDRDKLRAAIRKLGDEYVFYMLDDAIDMLPAAKLEKLVGQYVDLKRLRPDGARTTEKRPLLALVKDFDARSRAGEYYESFNVNSKNYMEKSAGTRSFIADCRRLLDRCVSEASRAESREMRACFETIFDLLRHIDDGRDDVVFFADEGGSWQVGVEWDKVFPAWFHCLSRAAGPEDFARLVVETVDAFEKHDRNRHIACARKLATIDQRRVLDGLADVRKGGRRR